MHRANVTIESYQETVREVNRRMKEKRAEAHEAEPTRCRKLKNRYSLFTNIIHSEN